MIRSVPVLAALLALAACEAAPTAPPPVADAACRWRPDGGPPPLITDRGIGGTGAPLLTERGIGGTGIGGTGIGGTGIVGIVTGFASICVDGLEVAYDASVPVEIDGKPANTDAMRVGQVVAIAASPAANRIAVRYEVSGPVESVEDVENGLIVVAGQRVRVPRSAVGPADVKPGAWVAVSGIRNGEGDVIASRLDPREPGEVTVHGPLIAADGMRWIGALEIAAKADDLAGSYVSATGIYTDGVLTAARLTPDLLVQNPPAFFGPGVTEITIAAYPRFDNGVVRVNGGFEAPLAAGFVPPANGRGLVAVRLQVQPGGSFAVVAVKPISGMAAGAISGTHGQADSNRPATQTSQTGGAAGAKTSTAAGAKTAKAATATGGSPLVRPKLSVGTAVSAGAAGAAGRAVGTSLGGAVKAGAAAAVKPASIKIKK